MEQRKKAIEKSLVGLAGRVGAMDFASPMSRTFVYTKSSLYRDRLKYCQMPGAEIQIDISVAALGVEIVCLLDVSQPVRDLVFPDQRQILAEGTVTWRYVSSRVRMVEWEFLVE